MREIPEHLRRERVRKVAEAMDSFQQSEAIRQAAAAFERDMQPICKALVEALQAGDMEALRGFRSSLPHLLAGVNADPALADILSHLLGKTLLDNYFAEASRQSQV